MKRTVAINEVTLKAVIAESVKRYLKEEAESAVDNKVIDLISLLHNAQLPLREIHWNTRENALHLTTDDAINDIFEWEDTLGEAFISDRNITLKINETKPSSNENFDTIMKDIIDLASEIKSTVSGNKSYDSICAVIDDIIETSNKHLYRGQFK